MVKQHMEKTVKEKKYYGAIDGLRTIAAIGIVMMHIATNNKYEISGFIYDHVIPSFTNFVFLFMTVSAFGMCCGYYEKVLKPTYPYWYLYALFFVFLITPTFKNTKIATIGLILALAGKVLILSGGGQNIRSLSSAFKRNMVCCRNVLGDC